MNPPLTSRQRLLLALLTFDAFLLGLLELFFLPLRLDGIVLPKVGDAPLPVTVVLAVLIIAAAAIGLIRVIGHLMAVAKTLDGVIGGVGVVAARTATVPASPSC